MRATTGRDWLRAWAWLLLLAGCWPAHARGQDAAARQPYSAADDPVDLAAERMVAWTDGSVRWVVLEGQAAVLQGVEGLRAERAVVKVAPQSGGDTPRFQVEVYAEGHVQVTDQPGTGRGSLRTTFQTVPGPALKPYSKSGLVQAPGIPANQRALVNRAFPASPSRPAAPPPVPQLAQHALPEAPRLPAPSGSASVEARPSASPPNATPAPLPAPEPAQRAVQPAAAAQTPPPTAQPAAELAAVDATAAPPGPLRLEAGTAVKPLPAPAPADPAVRKAQFGDDGFPAMPEGFAPAPLPEVPPIEMAPGEPQAPATIPVPGNDEDMLPDIGTPARPRAPENAAVPAPVIPFTQRTVSVYPRDAGPNFTFEKLETKNGMSTYVIRGGVNMVVEDKPNTPPAQQRGTVDISADSIVLWRGEDKPGSASVVGPNNELVQDTRQPLEVYLEGNVVFRQDERKVAGNGDQKTYRATRAYYDFRTERFVALDAELDMFAPGLITPVKVKGPEIQQYAPVVVGPDGRTTHGRLRITADNSILTGSRFATPGYRFYAHNVDIYQVPTPLTNPRTGKIAAPDGAPNTPQDLTWEIDARQNFYFMGPVPVFYWPRIVTDPEELDPPLRNIAPRFNNYFGQQLLTDWNAFKLFNIPKPKFVQVDTWNLDIDYLSRRKSMALGSEFGYFGTDFFSDIANDLSPDKLTPGYQRKNLFPDINGNYFGYVDFWGLRDQATDVLGPGPAIVTNGPPGAGKAGTQRLSDPAFQTFRGRIIARHMQSLNAPDDDVLDDTRLQLEFGYATDRNFLEQYYKRLFDMGLDQPTDAYFIRQRGNGALTILTEANLQSWYTDTQWAPKVDYYRLGDPLLDHLLTYYSDTGIDWANTHTAVEVNNPNIFAFLPYDPVSNTSGPLRTGRVYTNHELDLPIDLDVIRFVPYVQGQFVGWNNQLGGSMIGRVWGAAGLRANVMLWKRFPDVESELLNVHGLNHKINFDADYRDAFSNVHLNSIGVQDDLDDNTYEYVRRYFALTNYAGGLLPMQYDPRFLTLRRGISPITGTTDIQASIQMLQLGIHQRLQTKRGPEGKRRIIDYMILDLTSTYFPNATRDNFGKSFGQNMYNYEWYIGDRTSIYSYGWFEFFDIAGQPLFKVNPDRKNNPFGITVINSGVSINRPPRGNLTIGYSIIDTGTINTSAMNVLYSYWMSPKWYGTFGTSYDFGNAILLGSMFSLTRIGKDYLTSVGLAVDPQRHSYTFGFEVSPRLSPGLRLGSSSGMMRFDSRFAPTQ